MTRRYRRGSYSRRFLVMSVLTSSMSSKANEMSLGVSEMSEIDIKTRRKSITSPLIFGS